jgi:hypothetical protein
LWLVGGSASFSEHEFISYSLLCFSFAGRLASAKAANWQVVPSANSGLDANSLSSVAAASDNDVWAVGWAWNQSSNAYRTEIQHWDGSRWSLVRSPNLTNGYNLLNGVAVSLRTTFGQLVRPPMAALTAL